MKMLNRQPREAPITPDSFRSLMRCWTTGVSVVTSMSQSGERASLTANSVASVSAAPPLVSWCLDRATEHYETHASAHIFVINILAADQEPLCWRFAKKGDDKLRGTEMAGDFHGIPLIAGAVAHIECRTWARYNGGDHLIIVGEVTGARWNDRQPLALSHGKISLFKAAKHCDVLRNGAALPRTC